VKYIHNPKMAWFKSIQDIHHKMLQKDCRLTLQIDLTATPRHDNGAIFVQTVSDYPLVEAIYQNVVKHPVLPDAASREKLREKKTAIFSEKYADFLALGVEEWRKSYAEHEAMGKKAVLFVMVDDTKNCDEVGEYLQKICPELKDAVLTIHTKNNGDISEAATGKNKEELELLRKQSNEIDSWKSPFKAIVSVLMLKEGWDVRNVTTIVGLRAYVAKSNILPEQTLGRGLRRMYFGSDQRETVSVMGTPAFMDFVETIQNEGVTFDHVPMGAGAVRKDSLIVEIDMENTEKCLPNLEIPIPKMSRKFHRDFKDLNDLDPSQLGNQRLALKPFSPEETREIVFKTMLNSEIHHTVHLDETGLADYRSVVAFFTRQLIKDLRLVGGYDVLYPKVRDFIRDHLFESSPVNLEDAVVIRNLSEPDVGKVLYDSFKVAMNALTIADTGTTRIEDYIRLQNTRPFRTENRPFIVAKKSIFNKIVGEVNSGGFELSFASFLEAASDVVAFTKNYLAIGFKFDYVKANGDLSNYVPDFIVRDITGKVWIIETKGSEELDLPHKMKRLKQWCSDATDADENGTLYDFIYVDQIGYNKHQPHTLHALVTSFNEYKS
jgi:type III restriction enzyme